MRILYIDIDSLRPDHLGCYGYKAETGRDTSPHIDAIATQGVLFREYYAPDAPCLPSRTAMYSGRFGIQTGVVGHGGTAAEPKVEGRLRGFGDRFSNQGLALQLQKLGLHTAMISPFGQRHSAHWFYAGFNEVHNTGKGGLESAEEIWPTIDKWLDASASGGNWFLHINFWDPHTPYRVPMEVGEPFADLPLPAWMEAGGDDLIAEQMASIGPHTALDLGMYGSAASPKWPRQPGQITDRASLRSQIDGYDIGVWWADHYIGKIAQRLKALGVYDDMAVIVSADHGENEGELGLWGEHATADFGTCHIPLIIRWPGGRQGVDDDSLLCNVDLAPTLMDLLGGQRQPLWDGESFADAVVTDVTVTPSEQREDLVLSQGAHVCQRSVRWDADGSKWLYMRTYHDGFHLFPSEMLFDLTADPYEQHDTAAQRPDICREGSWRLMRCHDAKIRKMAETASDICDPLWTVLQEGGPFHAIHARGRSPQPKYLERLEATGRRRRRDSLAREVRRVSPVIGFRARGDALPLAACCSQFLSEKKCVRTDSSLIS